ncbi:hypothetical protein T552_03101 [Pneumocystis carinii B80]|uniref:SH3 domain-containing protein n=1 Tax=Pneumocystis carinii (strain B80) TaxID=1408658 RepID=A0A0W4ZCR2_PNEC8|nr:hypothetical protein T552_03101 [Pneumocystis carinii B80]KTW26210.1 hypothetical protein T552_03101 [Pneumocystis carinii B80]
MKLNNMQCRALYDYTSEYPEDLKFNAGQVIDILGVEDRDWYIGQYIDATGYRSIGIFPKNYVQLSEETEGGETNKKDIAGEIGDMKKNNEEEEVKTDKREKSEALTSEEPESKKSVKKSFREILDSFNTPKEEDIGFTTNRQSYNTKPRMCLSNTYINNIKQTETHGADNLQKEVSYNVSEQNTLQLGSLKDRILALRNIKFDSQEIHETNASNNNSTLEPIIEENAEQHNNAPKNVSSEIFLESSHNSFKPNKNSPSNEPENQKQGKNEDNHMNEEKKTLEAVSSKNNDSFMEEELARRAAIRERMAKMSHAGMNMHMALGISKQDSTYTGLKFSTKRTSLGNNEDKSQTTTPVFSVPMVPISPAKRPNRSHQLDNFSKSPVQNRNKEEMTVQNNSSEIIKHSLSNLHLSTPQKCHKTNSVSENNISFKDDGEDLEKSAIYYTPVPNVESFSSFLSKNSKNNSSILSNKTISPILIEQSPENSELSKLPQKLLKDPPFIPERPYSTHSSELFNNIDLSTQKQSTPCRPAKPIFISKSSLTSKCTSPILSQHDNRLSYTCNTSSESGFVSEEASKCQLSYSDFKDKSKYTYIFEEKQFCIDEDKLEENKNSRNNIYKNNISSDVIYEQNANDDISPISLTSSYVIQNIADDDDKVKRNIANNMFTQTNEGSASNLQYKYSKYPGSPYQQSCSEEYFSSPTSNISETDKKSNKYQSSAEKPYIRNQLSINELRGLHYSIDQRNINYDPFNQVEYIACNIDLKKDTLWWTRPNALPSIFQNRKDILLKFFESSHLLKDGNSIATKEIRILFHDYSETQILVTFNKKNPENADLKQIHRPSPIKPNQNQLEIAYEKFGTQVANLASLHTGITIGDGSPFAFIQNIISNIPDALPPTGVRAYGAVIYQNRANASIEQRDEIKTGDIVSFRNVKFQGHKGTLHTKYSTSVGNPDHAAVIMEWDGTKRKIKVWEQGRISKKVIQSSFRIGDLKSGEICIWRVMSKSWVNWNS